MPAPSSPAVTVAVNEGRGKRPEATEVDMEPARGGGDDLWSVQAEAEVAQGGEYPEHLVIMVNGLVGRWIRIYCYFGRLCSGFVQLWGFLVSVAKCDHCFTVRMTGSLQLSSS